MSIARSSNLLGKITIFFALFVLLSIGSGAVVGKTIHVKVGGTGDGSSWANAYGELQAALDDADPNDEIWVAEGMYKPTELFDPCDPRSPTFQMKNHVGIYGGFPAVGDPNRYERDWDEYKTVLSGDLLGNDIEVADLWDMIDDPSRVDNCYHVFYHPEGTNLDTNSVLDGFTITGSNNDGASSYDPNSRGGGMYNYHSGPMVNNCTFSGNLATGGFESFGSGMYNENSSPTITNCIFSRNLTTSYLESYGGGMYNKNSNPTIANCTFSGNSTHDVCGGICNVYSSPTITNCTFMGNSAYSGGGMFNAVSNPTLINCTFSNNTAADGGGIFNSFYSNPMIRNCILRENSASDYGGGILNTYHSSPTITNCTFIGNSATNNYESFGGGMYNERSSPPITNCTFTGNSAHSGGGIYNEESNAMISNCILWSNEPNEIYDDALSSTTVTYSDIEGGWPGTGNINAHPCFVALGYRDYNATHEDANDDFWVDGDYHLRSQAGRWDANSESWVQDDVTSPCIDAGNPGCPLGDEPNDPNNLRINMGSYGGTAEASKTPKNWRSIADLTNDWVVDFNDLRVFVSYWLETGGCVPSDLNRSQNVDFFDYAIFAFNWLQESKISSHVFYIDLTCSWDYGSPDYSWDTAYVFEVEISTDGRIDYIEFSSPNDGNTFVITNTPLTKYPITGGTMEIGREFDSETGQYYWLYNPRFESPNSLSEYGDGLYSFTFYYTNGDQQHTTVWYGIPDTEDPIPQPTQMPVFTSFSNGDTVTSPVTFEWEGWLACTGLAASSIELDPEHESGEEMEFHLPSCATGLDEPIDMTAGFWEDVELGFEWNYLFENPDGIAIRASKYSESDYEITVVLLSKNMVEIPGGEFDMGDHFSEGNPDELPVHTVLLDSFFMSKFEITNQQYCDYLNAAYPAQIKVVSGVVYASGDSSNSQPYFSTSSAIEPPILGGYGQIDYNDGVFSVRTKAGRDMSQDPVIMVSWYGAADYCNWRSEQEEYEALYDPCDPNWPCDFSKTGYRLPTEAEWEYAARGGNHTPYYRFPLGDTISHSQANYIADPCEHSYDVSPTEGYHPDFNDGIQPYTAPVGSFSANGYSLYDMTGNVWEWCNDFWSQDYYNYSPYDNPQGTTIGLFRILRSGGWDHHTDSCRVAGRGFNSPVYRSGYNGFRVVLDLN